MEVPLDHIEEVETVEPPSQKANAAESDQKAPDKTRRIDFLHIFFFPDRAPITLPELLVIGQHLLFGPGRFLKCPVDFVVNVNGPAEQVGTAIQKGGNRLGLHVFGIVISTDATGNQELEALKEFFCGPLFRIGGLFGIAECGNVDRVPEEGSPYRGAQVPL